jgi:pyruvate,water dikinase
MGVRESAKFFAIRTMGISRQALLEVGEEFIAAGTLDRADDLFFLRLKELEALARGEGLPPRPRPLSQEERGVSPLPPGEGRGEGLPWKALIARRRAIYERELRRRQVPRVLVSDGRAFYEGLGAAAGRGDDIIGSPVSPGVVEGIVHVVLDPRSTQLAPGEILVCPGTDPAWTPLFLAAGGLVTEVGGVMTHGSVVAREYGIPAVVGVHQATLRLKTGQRIRLDGTSGVIQVLE